ncbi:hypothetical protein ACG7TL_002584 [Trametes sanguinea]
MPERAEIFVQHQQVLYFIQHTSAEDRQLRAIWVDPTTEEQRTSPATSPARAGLVYRLPAGATIRRGAKKKETTVTRPSPQGAGAGTKRKGPSMDPGKSQSQSGYAVYPFWLCNNLAKDSYVLVASHFNPQSLILEFRNTTLHALYFDVRLLPSSITIVQIFAMSEWRDSICKVPRDRRGFKVAIALDLGSYIIAFLSHDLLFQVYWANNIRALPSNTVVDVLHDWPGFLRVVACWVQQRRARARSRDKPAFLIIHQADVFAGLGNYTLSEVFHRAGLRLSLSESELFDNPSRTARLCMAYREFAIHTQSALWPSMKRFFHGFKIAVERSDRLLYSKHLKVYGKEWTWVTARQGALLNAAISAEKNQGGPIYDVFEPSLVAASLAMEHGNLGHLIFGAQEWASLQRLWGLHVAEPQDALTMLYRPFGRYQRTYLRPGYYQDGLAGGQWNAQRFSTSMYRFALTPFALSPSPIINSNDDNDDDDADVRKPKKVRTFQAWSIIPR